MKKIALALFLLAAASAHAAVITLNNNNPSPGQHSTLAAAMAAALPGDTILVHGSATSYGSGTLSKSLTILGPGHKPRTTLALTALFGTLTIADNVNTVRFIGIKCTAISAGSNVDNLTIENSYVTNSIGASTNCNTWLLKNSVLTFVSLTNTNITDLIITNNYFSNAAVFEGFGGTGSKLVINNIFAWNGTGSVFFAGNTNNTIFENNIFYGSTPNAGTFSNCTFNRNLTYLTSNNALPPAGQAGTGNLTGVNPLFQNVFTPPAASDFSYTSNYRLQAGSPAKGTGTNGTDMGIYEPDNEFSMTGEPGVPQTISVSMSPASLPVGGTTQVNFTIRKSTPNAQ